MNPFYWFLIFMFVVGGLISFLPLVLDIIDNMVRSRKVAKSMARHMIRSVGCSKARAAIDQSIKIVGMHSYMSEEDKRKLNVLFSALKYLDIVEHEVNLEKVSAMYDEDMQRAEKEVDIFLKGAKM